VTVGIHLVLWSPFAARGLCCCHKLLVKKSDIGKDEV
jgi:hypothetical protein